MTDRHSTSSTAKCYVVIFLSYDEPNADQNFKLTQLAVGDLLRVHGVKGFDSAHKACAALAREHGATHFFTVDGDNELHPRAWHQIEQELRANSSSYLNDNVYSWRAINSVNGLSYGNGGLKLWPCEWVEQMRTHENSEKDVSVDFCWRENYKQMRFIASQTNINGSAYQAWRAGYREGVKMLLNNGQPQARSEIAKSVSYTNIRRFVAWSSLGRDVKFGGWAIIGALQGAVSVLESQELVTRIIDFSSLHTEYLNLLSYIEQEGSDLTSWSDPLQECDALAALAKKWRSTLMNYNIDVPAFGPMQSAAVKSFFEYTQPSSPFEEETWNDFRW